MTLSSVPYMYLTFSDNFLKIYKPTSRSSVKNTALTDYSTVADGKLKHNTELNTLSSMKKARVVRCGKGVVYLTSPGCPTEIGLQLDKTCYPCSR